jgi:hypothetical protein
MTRPYVLCMLLEHGPLTWVEAREITGWSDRIFGRALERCLQRRWIRRTVEQGTHCFVYELV